MRMIKISEGFFTDFDNISTLIIEPGRIWNETEHKIDEYLSVEGITPFGAKLPIPLLTVNYDDQKIAMKECEAFIMKFWSLKN